MPTATKTATRNKRPTSMRLTPQATKLIAAIAKKNGLTRAAVIEMAVRKLAEIEGIK